MQWPSALQQLLPPVTSMKQAFKPPKWNNNLPGSPSMQMTEKNVSVTWLSLNVWRPPQVDWAVPLSQTELQKISEMVHPNVGILDLVKLKDRLSLSQ